MLDWTNSTPPEKIVVLDASSGKVLDTRFVSSFSGGKYLAWTISGHVQVQLSVQGQGAPVSAIFFDPMSGAPGASPNSATFVNMDLTTQGSWVGAYGPDGYGIANDLINYPGYAQVTTDAITHTWANPTTDVRGLQLAENYNARSASTWYNNYGSFLFDVKFTDGKTHQVALYLLDWEPDYREERIDVLDVAGINGSVLDSRWVKGFSGGMYLVWNVRGHVQIQITAANFNAVVSAIFFSTPGTPDFTIATSPGSQIVSAGNGASYPVSVTALNGFSGTVNLSVIGLPAGATGIFNPASVINSGSATLVVTTGAAAPAGSYSLTVIGNDGSLVNTATTTLTVGWPTQGLLGYWNFNEDSGTTANDTSGNGYNGTVSGATWVAGYAGSALSFNGLNSEVVTASIPIVNTFSITAWVNPAIIPQKGYVRIAETRYYSGLYLGTNAAGTQYKFIANNGAGTTGVCGASFGCVEGGAITGGWHLVTGTYDGTTAKLYVDNTLVASDTFEPDSSIYPLFIGRNYASNSYSWNGVIDEVRLYNRALSSPEVSAIYRYNAGPPDTSPPTVSITAPAPNSTVSNTITVSANATDNVGVATVQFQLDGARLGAVLATAPYSISWDTTTVSNGMHTLTAIATDTAGNSVTSAGISVIVSDGPPVISGVASAISSLGATISWTTDQPSNSQVSYGATSSYGLLSPLNQTMVTAHSVNLSGLTASTTYHYQMLSQNTQASVTASADYTFTTASAQAAPAAPLGLQPLLQMHLDATEVSGVSNGSVVTPSIAPAGFTGKVVANGSGSVNFTPAQSGNGVYFLNCCVNGNNAYYKFTGATLGNIFNLNQGQITFYLKSRYSFAQRTANAAAPRYAFDVQDVSGHHLFNFLTQVSGGYLFFNYTIAGFSYYTWAPQGTEDTLFGNGVVLQVTMTWNAGVTNLYLNGTLVRTMPYAMPTTNWTAGSVFDLGAYEYMTYGGFNGSDDVIDEFTVLPSAH